MATRPSETEAATATADIQVTELRSYVDWAAVIAGALIATAMSFLLTTFGSAIGLSVASPWHPRGLSAETIGIAAAIWFAVTHIYSIGMGAYFTGRMRPRTAGMRSDEVSFRDSTNGLVMWALSLMIVVWFATSVIGGATQLAGTAAGGVVEVVKPIAEQANDTLLRSLTQQEGQQPAAGEIKAPTPEQRQEVLRILQRGFAAGAIREEDRSYLAQLVESTTGIPAEQAEERVRTTITQATERAKEVTERARKATALSGFLGALVLLLSGMAAWWAASLGGRHRDEASTGQFTR